MQRSNAAILQSGNLYVYAMNNPVRFIDPSGLWTQAVHERLTRTVMTALGDSRRMTGMFNYHANHIARGNLSIDESPYWAINPRGDASSRHFNRNATGTDSRIAWGDYYLDKAVNMWLNGDSLYASGDINFDQRYEKRVQALFYLGRGLHSVQDIDAHLDFGMHTIDNMTGNWNHITSGMFNMVGDALGLDFAPPHLVVGEIDPRNSKFDNPRYDLWKDNAGNWHAIDSGSDFGSRRYANSETQTRHYLSRFYRKIGIIQ